MNWAHDDTDVMPRYGFQCWRISRIDVCVRFCLCVCELAVDRQLRVCVRVYEHIMFVRQTVTLLSALRCTCIMLIRFVWFVREHCHFFVYTHSFSLLYYLANSSRIQREYRRGNATSLATKWEALAALLFKYTVGCLHIRWALSVCLSVCVCVVVWCGARCACVWVCLTALTWLPFSRSPKRSTHSHCVFALCRVSLCACVYLYMFHLLLWKKTSTKYLKANELKHDSKKLYLLLVGF